jgi:magnesium transporter
MIVEDSASHTVRLRNVREALDSGFFQQLRAQLFELHAAEIAHLLESLPEPKRSALWELVDQEHEGEVLVHLSDDLRTSLIREMAPDELVAAAAGMDIDDLADLLQDLPDTISQTVLQSLDKQNRQRLVAVMSYPEDTAGGLMNTDAITIRPDMTVDVVLRYLRLRGEIPDHTDSLFVVDRQDRYFGVVKLAKLLASEPQRRMEEVMDRDVEGIIASRAATEVAQLFENRDLVSAAVVDDNGKLIGRITIDDVVDVIRDEADHSLLGLAGLEDDESIFAPIWSSAKRRALWLGINLFNCVIVSSAIGLFKGTLEKIVALAVLMPIVANMSGVAGNQSLTLAIRGIALGQVGEGNAWYLLRKELTVGAINGVVWAVALGLFTTLMYRDPHLGIVIASAMALSLALAAMVGVSIPLALNRLGVDPAIAGTAILTTITDLCGFVSFLTLASLFLL